MNAMVPTASGVISSPDPRQQDSIQVANRHHPMVIPNQTSAFLQAKTQQRRGTVNVSDDEADVDDSADIGSHNDSVHADEDFKTTKKIAVISTYRKAK